MCLHCQSTPAISSGGKKSMINSFSLQWSAQPVFHDPNSHLSAAVLSSTTTSHVCGDLDLNTIKIEIEGGKEMDL